MFKAWFRETRTVLCVQYYLNTYFTLEYRRHILLLDIYNIFPYKSANHKAIKPSRSAGEESCAHSATWWQIGEPRDRFISAPPLLSHPLLARNLWGPRTGYLEVGIICFRDTFEIFEEQILSQIFIQTLVTYSGLKIKLDCFHY